MRKNVETMQAAAERISLFIFEPYYGGSHKTFLDGLLKNLPIDPVLFTLPARKWKWRMRLAAPYFAMQLQQMTEIPDKPDALLCSSFMDVAVFRSLLPGWLAQVPILTYFHENQYAYPVQVEDERDHHFLLSNYTTVLASDRVAFNSSYNLESFIEGIGWLLKKSPDMKIQDCEQQIRSKSRVLYPGIDFSGIDDGPIAEIVKADHPVIVWNHRWEHDKGPDLFFETLLTLESRGVDFGLIVTGESFARQPEIFDKAKERLGSKIIHFGYVDSRQEYFRLLKCADLVVSTAKHEFFGMAVIEAVRAGCRPVLPNRLSYPELFPAAYLYDEENLLLVMTKLLQQKQGLDRQTALDLTAGFSWQELANDYYDWLS